jgi:hypothetical protein
MLKMMTLKRIRGVSTAARRDGLMRRQKYLEGEVETSDTESACLRHLIYLISP